MTHFQREERAQVRSAESALLRPAVATSVSLSVVVPVYNEEAVLTALFARLYPALDALGVSYEIVFINDGSRDRSAQLLAEQFEVRPDVTRVILFNGNFGQHRAILAGFDHARGERVVTLDADLQNPPEDIVRLVAALDAGHDYVGSIRRTRQDVAWRRWASKAMNRLRARITRIEMTDQGCMMRAYSRNIVQLINQCGEMNTFIPALAFQFARNPTEIEVGHEDRHAGESKYSLYSLIRLNFDLITGFSIAPLQYFTMFAMLCCVGSGVFVVTLAIRRIFFDYTAAEGLFTLFGVLFFLMSVALVGIGLIGEYVGRTYQVVRARQRYHVREMLETKS